VTAVRQEPGIGVTGDDLPTVYVALNAVMRKVTTVRKRSRNSAQNYNFRGIDDVLNAVGPAFRAHGIIPVPILQTSQYRDVKTSTNKPSRECTVTVAYRFYGPAGDFVEVIVPGESMDTGDKGAAKAMSVAFRTALIQLLALATGDPDPDSQSYERGSGRPDVSAAADEREQGRPSREEMLEQINTVIERLKSIRQESDYVAYEKLAKFCTGRLGVNIVSKQTAEGAIEEVDLNKLKDGQMWLLLDAMRKSLQQLTAATQEV